MIKRHRNKRKSILGSLFDHGVGNPVKKTFHFNAECGTVNGMEVRNYFFLDFKIIIKNVTRCKNDFILFYPLYTVRIIKHADAGDGFMKSFIFSNEFQIIYGGFIYKPSKGQGRIFHFMLLFIQKQRLTRDLIIFDNHSIDCFT